jgi:hypothetical protein
MCFVGKKHMRYVCLSLMNELALTVTMLAGYNQARMTHVNGTALVNCES